MCLRPVTIRPGVQIACRKCSLCRQKRVDDFIGRAIAEQSVSIETLSLTLTYRETGTQSSVLHYNDVQLMLKHLRADGYKVRYICAGEYGTLKGRAHWHIILFFSGDKRPNLTLASNVSWKYWPHGHIFAQNADVAGFRYILKYCLKSDRDNALNTLTMSKKPPLGFMFFMRLAQDMVSARLALNSPEYSFASVRTRSKSDGIERAKVFWLQNRMADLFFERYVSLWRETYNEEPPASEFIFEKYYDPVSKAEMADDPYFFDRDLNAKRLERDRALINRKPSPSILRRQVAFLLTRSPNSGCCVLYSDGSAVYTEGSAKWLLNAKDKNLAESLKGITTLTRQGRSAVLEWLTDRLQRFEAASSASR